MNRSIIIVIVTFLITVFLFFIGSSLSYSRSRRVISCQSSDKNSFCLSVLTHKYITGSKHYLFITRGNDGTYGEMISYPETYSNKLDTIKAEWNDKGLKITTPLGYELFIAKSRYEAGR